jgi:hypothetical protein
MKDIIFPERPFIEGVPLTEQIDAKTRKIGS